MIVVPDRLVNLGRLMRSAAPSWLARLPFWRPLRLWPPAALFWRPQRRGRRKGLAGVRVESIAGKRWLADAAMRWRIVFGAMGKGDARATRSRCKLDDQHRGPGRARR